MRQIREATFDEYATSYLTREATKRGKEPSVPMSPEERRAEMEREHAGKLREWFPDGDWTVEELDVPTDLWPLICLESEWTKRHGLTPVPGHPGSRMLESVVQRAMDTGYFTDDAVGADEVERRRRYLEKWKSSRIDLTGGERVVLRTATSGELRSNPAGTLYLHDGIGRLLTVGYLLQSGGSAPADVRIEAFVARGPER